LAYYAFLVLEIFTECFFVLVTNQIVKNIIKSIKPTKAKTGPPNKKIPPASPMRENAVRAKNNTPTPTTLKPVIHTMSAALGNFGFFLNLSLAPYTHRIIPGIRKTAQIINITVPIE
jgi:hypothetical protein